MKNSVLLMVLFLVSCYPNDSYNSNKSTQKLIHKITIKSDLDASKNQILEFVYDENKNVVQINSSNGNDFKFKYQGNQLVEIKKNTEVTEVFYNSDTLSRVKTTYMENEFKNRKEYYYNELKLPDSIVICNDELTCESRDVYQYFYSSDYNVDSTYVNNTKTILSYNLNNNPFKNHNVYLRLLMNDVFYPTYTSNVIEKEMIYNSIDDSTPSHEITYTSVYDEDKFPVKIVGEKEGQEVILYEFEYINPN
ncbi:MAG: hypothetical protein H6604_02990 [Flavobacteriales bacterium]|nr:hypothetical protein [Flavobacteriales bacterium]